MSGDVGNNGQGAVRERAGSRGWRLRLIRGLASLLAVCVALALRLRAVDRLPVDYDEPIYLRAGQIYADAIRRGDWGEIPRIDYNIEHPPLTKLVYGAVLTFLPEIPEVQAIPDAPSPPATLPEPHREALRLTSAIFGVLEVGAMALASPLAALLLAVHTFTIKYTSQIYLEAVPALMSLVVVLAYIRSRRVWGAPLVLSAAALGLTAASKYIYAVAGVAVIVDWISEALAAARSGEQGRMWREVRNLTLWCLLSVIVFFLADPYLWADPVGRLKESIFFNVSYSQSAHVESAGLPPWQPLTWLMTSVPWHPGVFVVTLDLLVTLLGLLGLPRLWRRHRVAALWLLVGLGFLFVWPTRWPQYILILTAPMALSAAYGFGAVIADPIRRRFTRRPDQGSESGVGRGVGREGRQAMPWLVPGLMTLGLIILFPLLFQAAMSLTDLNVTSIRDGLTGGVWREVWLGLTGQVEPVEIQPFGFNRVFGQQVHYAGPSILVALFSGAVADILSFEVVWTVLAVGLQTALGMCVALMLNRRGMRLTKVWRTLFILPWVIPEFVGALVWARVFDPRFGWLALAASFPERPGFPAAVHLPNWQSDPVFALVALLVASTWMGFPFIMLAATAALRLIPREVYDSATLDGAVGWRGFWAITWPLLVPLLAPAMIIRAILAFNQFYLFTVLPTPFVTFATVSYYLLGSSSQMGGQFAISAAINIFAVVALMVFILFFNRWSKAAEGVTYA